MALGHHREYVCGVSNHHVVTLHNAGVVGVNFVIVPVGSQGLQTHCPVCVSTHSIPCSPPGQLCNCRESAGFWGVSASSMGPEVQAALGAGTGATETFPTAEMPLSQTFHCWLQLHRIPWQLCLLCSLWPPKASHFYPRLSSACQAGDPSPMAARLGVT